MAMIWINTDESMAFIIQVIYDGTLNVKIFLGSSNTCPEMCSAAVRCDCGNLSVNLHAYTQTHVSGQTFVKYFHV